MSTHKWQFAPRFRRHIFGWRSDTPILRIKEAIAEIKQVAKKEPVTAAEGAVIFIEKLSPALEQVDSSSGSLGTTVNRAIDILVPIIAKSHVDKRIRQQWLERLWEAVENDGMTYIESLGEYWGELCVTAEVSSTWADRFIPLVEHIWSQNASGYGFYKGTTACMASLYSAGRYEQLLSLLEKAPFKWWHDRRWGVKALSAMGKKAEALSYAEGARGLNDPGWQIAQECEAILLASGMADEAYRRYAMEANQGTTNLATFRAISKKYPHKTAQDILRDLVASQPGSEGRWFAAAKDAGLFDLAIELVTHSPADPRTLARAAKDFCTEQPSFAVASGLAALRWISLGYGYEVTSLDVLDAYDALIQALPGAGLNEDRIKEQIRELSTGSQPGSQFLQKVLARHLLP